jgi:hypothetical protein
MSQLSAIDILVEALTALPEYDNPLNPIYEVLGQQRLLTLHAIRKHTQLLHDRADQARDQTFAVNKVILSCKRIPPTPLSDLPWGF